MWADANGTTCSPAAVVWADAAVNGRPYGWSRLCRADSAESEELRDVIERGLWQLCTKLGAYEHENGYGNDDGAMTMTLWR